MIDPDIVRYGSAVAEVFAAQHSQDELDAMAYVERGPVGLDGGYGCPFESLEVSIGARKAMARAYTAERRRKKFAQFLAFKPQTAAERFDAWLSRAGVRRHP